MSRLTQRRVCVCVCVCVCVYMLCVSSETAAHVCVCVYMLCVSSETAAHSSAGPAGKVPYLLLLQDQGLKVHLQRQQLC